MKAICEDLNNNVFEVRVEWEQLVREEPCSSAKSPPQIMHGNHA